MQMQPDEERCGWNIAARSMGEPHSPAPRWESASAYTRPSHRVPFRIVVVRTILLFVVAVSWTNGQQQVFGTVKAFPLPGTSGGMALLPETRDKEARMFLWTPGYTTAFLGTLNSDRSSIAWSNRLLPGSTRILAASDINGDGLTDLIGVAESDSMLFVISEYDRDTLVVAMALRLPFLPSGVSTVPMTSGGNPELLLFNPDNPGILPVIGLAQGRPRLGRIIVPDMPVGAVATAHLNDDGINDIIAYDWVRNELHLLYGVGQARFLDQTTFSVSDGISQFLAATSGNDDIANLVLVSSDSMKIHLWHGDGLGDFKPLASFETASAVRNCRVRDVNSDGWADIVYLDKRGALHALLNAAEDEMEDGPEVAAGREPLSFEFLSPDGPASVVFDPAAGQLLLFEDARRRVLADSLRYATGLAPASLLLADVNNDAHPDIAVATTGSRSLEFFLSDTTGAFGGATVLHLNEECYSLALHSVSDSLARFIVSYSGRDAISFVTYNLFDRSHSEAVIPGVGVLEPLSPVDSSGRIEYYCYAVPGESVTSSLSLFQELSGSRFIERSFKLTIPDVLMGVAVADLDRDKRTDVAYVYHNAVTGTYEFVTAFGDSTGEFSRRGITLQLPDSSIAKCYLYFTDVDKDSVPDVLLCLPKHERTIRLALGDSSGAFSDPGNLGENIGFENRAQLQIQDIDGDGNVDIVVNDPEWGGVGYLKGHGDGGFDSWRTLYVGNGISHYGFADFNGDGTKDLVLAMKYEGTLKLLSGKLIFRQ